MMMTVAKPTCGVRRRFSSLAREPVAGEPVAPPQPRLRRALQQSQSSTSSSTVAAAAAAAVAAAAVARTARTAHPALQIRTQRTDAPKRRASPDRASRAVRARAPLSKKESASLAKLRGALRPRDAALATSAASDATTRDDDDDDDAADGLLDMRVLSDTLKAQFATIQREKDFLRTLPGEMDLDDP
jgi:hypothetical protein